MGDRILGGACVLAAAAMAWAAKGYVAPISYEPMGPRSFPLLLSVLIAIAGLWLMLRPGLTASGTWSFSHLRPIGICALAIVAYTALFETLGFTLATALMSVPVGMAFGGHWLKCLIGGAGLGLVLFFGFDKLLDVVLPSGILSFILGGR